MAGVGELKARCAFIEPVLMKLFSKVSDHSEMTKVAKPLIPKGK
jgi:hypothetical protein